MGAGVDRLSTPVSTRIRAAAHSGFCAYDETVDGGLVLPRGLSETVAALVEQAGSRLN